MKNIIKDNILQIRTAFGDFGNVIEQGTLKSTGEKSNDTRRVRFANPIKSPFYVKTNDGFIIRIVCLYDKETLDLVSYAEYKTKTEFVSDGKYAVGLVFGREDIYAQTDIYADIFQSVNKSIVSLFDSQGEIELCKINELPQASKRRLAVIKPSEMTQNCGPVWSDSYVWRWINNNKLAVSAKSYYTAKVSDGTEVISSNKTGVFESASITKLLAVLTAIEYITNFNDTVTVTAFDNKGVGHSDTWVKEDDVITYTDLYHAILLPSDNAAARALGRIIGYKINPDALNDDEAYTSFCNKMKEVAMSIGMTNSSNFVNSWTNLHSTTEDLVKLVICVYKTSSIITEIWGKLSCDITITGVNARTYTVTHTINQTARQTIPEFKGGKTGSGDKYGGWAFIWLNPNDNELYATALLDVYIVYDGGHNPRWTDARNIIDEVYRA